MKYFKDENGKPWAYEDNVKEEQIRDGLTSITDEEYNILNGPIQVIMEAKNARILALSQITVTTTNGNTFDGDDTARADMLNAISASETTQAILESKIDSEKDTYISDNNLELMMTIDANYIITHLNWKLVNNNWEMTPIAEMKEASALAIQAKGVILAS